MCSGRPFHEHGVRQSVLGAQPWNAVGVERDAVPRSELPELNAVEATTALCGREVGEEALKPTWRDDLKHAAGVAIRIPEGVPLAARLRHQLADFGIDDLVTQLSSQTSLEHVAVLVLV